MLKLKPLLIVVDFQEESFSDGFSTAAFSRIRVLTNVRPVEAVVLAWRSARTTGARCLGRFFHLTKIFIPSSANIPRLSLVKYYEES